MNPSLTYLVPSPGYNQRPNEDREVTMDRWSVKEWLRGVARVRPRKPVRRWTEVDTDIRNKHWGRETGKEFQRQRAKDIQTERQRKEKLGAPGSLVPSFTLVVPMESQLQDPPAGRSAGELTPLAPHPKHLSANDLIPG